MCAEHSHEDLAASWAPVRPRGPSPRTTAVATVVVVIEIRPFNTLPLSWPLMKHR